MDNSLIKRHDAIDTLTENKEMINAVLDSLTLDYNTRRNQEQRRGQINEDIETIKALPSAQSDVTDRNVGDMIDRQAVIDTEGLNEQIRCEMCRNPMHTDRGCDGNCKYDEKLYERIMQILGERIKPLPSTEPEIAENLYLCKCYITDQDGLQHEVIHTGDIRRVTGWEI